MLTPVPVTVTEGECDWDRSVVPVGKTIVGVGREVGESVVEGEREGEGDFDAVREFEFVPDGV